MKRGDLVVVAVSGDYGKPRRALVIQAEIFNSLPSVTLLPLTSYLREAPLLRVDAPTSEESGLQHASQIMIDKAVTVPRGKIGRRIGHVDQDTLLEVERAFAAFVGLA